jgi:hypothetical protein
MIERASRAKGHALARAPCCRTICT